MIDLIRREIARALTGRVVVEFGEVTSVDWTGQRVRVRLLSGQATGWLRVGAGAAFSQGGSVSPIKSGDEVMVAFAQGNPAGAGVVISLLYGATAVPTGMPENSFGWAQGQKRVIFDASGKVACTVAQFDVIADGTASIDGTSVVLGQGVMAATKYEALAAPLMVWIGTVTAALAALGIVTPVPNLTAARAAKVKVG